MKKLVNYNAMLKDAVEHHYCIGGMNSFNLESVQAIIRAADDVNTPVIVQVHHSDLRHATPLGMARMTEAVAAGAKVDVAVGLDHGQSFDQAIECIDAGFTAVMIDLSNDDFDLNVDQTIKVVEYGHARGVSVEAELGNIVMGSDSPEKIAAGYTDPDQAREFVERTGVDCLAVSVGTAHGFYAHTPVINFDLVKTLVECVPCPIVVHGGSGVPDEDIMKMVKMGIAKLNIGTDMFNAYTQGVAAALEGYDGTYQRRLTQKTAEYAREYVYKVAKHKMELMTAYRD